jgi:hypothetical protein
VPGSQSEFEPYKTLKSCPPSRQIRAGDRLTSGSQSGTLGCIMKSGSEYLGLTAGHVLAHGIVPDWGVFAQHGKGASASCVHEPVLSQNFTDQSRLNGPHQPQHSTHQRKPSVRRHIIRSGLDRFRISALPSSTRSLRVQATNQQVTVYKDGIASERTTGRLTGFEHQFTDYLDPSRLPHPL